MTDRLVVNFAALQQASTDIQTALNAMESGLDDARQTAQPLVSTWDGDARAMYDARQAKWTQAATDLSTMLRDIKRAVEDSAMNYQQTENRNANLFT